MRITLKGTILAVAGAALCTRAVLLVVDVQAAQHVLMLTRVDSEKSADLAQKERLSVGTPVRVRIPVIGVNAQVESVGLTPQGTMGAPEGPKNVGWFSQGLRPGAVGTAVIDGHFGWRDGIQAVFDNLSKVRIGDRIYVEDSKGATIAFTVKGLRVYDENEDTAGIFSSTDGKSHLNLITCGGIWNPETHTYSDRLVVFANKEG